MTYASAELTETFKVFEQHGIRFLTAEEIPREMPPYPLLADGKHKKYKENKEMRRNG